MIRKKNLVLFTFLLVFLLVVVSAHPVAEEEGWDEAEHQIFVFLGTGLLVVMLVLIVVYLLWRLVKYIVEVAKVNENKF